MACPVCESEHFDLAIPAATLDYECDQRSRFVDARLSRPISESERKDLTEFFHAGRAELLRCTICGQLVRRELEALPSAEYSGESYDPAVIEWQYPRYLRAFRSKRDPYQTLLPSGARVIEVGSHYGAFLQTASEWGWRAEGVDVGTDTSRFAESKGFTVHRCELQDCAFPPASLDAVFVWNCFEQIEDPRPLLDECRRVLKPNGLLLLRTPNGVFYRLCRRLLDGYGAELGEAARGFLIDALGYNNLLGFPYLYGYSADRLLRCAERHGFRSDGMLNSELLTLPLPEDPDWVRREERIVNDQVQFLAQWTLTDRGMLMGPWIECRFRLVTKTY